MDGAGLQDSGDLQRHIAKARRRSWEAIAIACIAVLYAVGSDLIDSHGESGSCESTSFLLTTSEDVPRGSWRAEEDTSSFMMSSRGNTGLHLSVRDDGNIRIAFFGAGLTVPIEISLGPDGRAVLSFRRSKGKLALAVGVTEQGEPFAALFDQNGTPRFSAEIDADGAAVLKIRDDNGHVVWRAP